MIKNDMGKAYDQAKWDFVLAVLKAFGFPGMFCTLIYNCVCLLLGIW